ncbi:MULTISPECIES: O-antigen ligase [unclassified Mycolicibacterium]|uniref:O-antigen ligase family protein n=1 Tax=unclassified Mycolicibacterium TaxID=2636767 RepID=UPI0012DD6319|nr:MULTISPECIES: O-antigen ligase family protein [unclassified Mycolicibacterium]MUL81739.1 O-antigen ligase domain-containing protein [Mycolicibacterium sp. CBMA 329]MUL87505.1 O-antigen ligase domain-containing protein [Mycolicibacterium sp. CBMA 331]MUL99630.1 O-antigen ligase domain-containing protein [Mycolicibacterium sp. CBMA 334]MUM26727.1 O-antigen ligase domain-containing protein [Mycolicibacterium sp. CBMA 295]MUM37802.1 O-antigen ligase domain-containing protein [Mycolicibacterium 
MPSLDLSTPGAPVAPRSHREQVGPLILAAGGFFLLGMRQTFTVPLTFGLSLGQFLLYIGAAVWALMGMAGRKSPIANRWLVVAILVYLTASLLSYGAALNRGTVLLGIEFADRYIFSDLALSAMIIAIIAMITTPDRVSLLLKGLVLGAALSASFAIMRLVAGIDLAPMFILPGLKASDFVLVTNLAREGIDRPQGSAGHPLELAGVLTVVLPLSIAVVACARAKGERTWPWLLCTGLLLCGALATVSRSVIVGLTAALLVMAWRWSIHRFAALLLTAAAAVGLGMLAQLHVVSAILQSFANVSSDSSIASRGLGAAYVANHYRDHFWVGQGTGMYPAYRQPVLDNQYLSRLMETGALGLLSFVLLIGVALLLALLASAAADPIVAELAGAISGSLAALAVISTILDISGFIQIWTVTWILIALSTVVWRLHRQPGNR